MPPPVRRTLDGQLADILTRLGILETRPRGGSGGGGSTAWGDITGKPPTFPPSAHTHPSSQITDFATAVPAAMPAASDTVAGKVELATDLETQVGTDGARAVTPLSLNSRTATEGRTGLVELATSAETAAGSDATRAITPAGLLGRTATEARIGLAEIATTAEVTTGTDDARFVTPLKLKQAITAIPAAPPATETTAGLIELATSAETIAGTDATRAVTPAGLAANTASETNVGIVELATTAEVVAGTDTTRAVTAAGVKAFFDANPGSVPAASDTVAGKVELATSAEAVAGTDTARAVTPAALKAAMLATIYPVGSIFMSTVNTNPGTYLGGTWVAWGAGRVAVGVDTSQTEFNTVEKTGGAKTHALTEAQLPAHQHPLSSNGGNVRYAEAGGANLYTVGFGQTRPGNGDVTTGSQNGKTLGADGAPHNNLQPYITAYMFKRTA